jgi:uncharacterized membrane protein
MAMNALALGLTLSTGVLAADFRGFASPGPLGVVLFQACQGKDQVRNVTKIEDATPDSAMSAGLEAVREIMLGAGRPIYVEFRGNPAGKGVKATEFVRAIGTLESCAAALDSLPPRTRFWAGGQDPTWQLVVTPGEARFERPGEKPIRFPATPFALSAKPAAKRTVDAWSPMDGGTVRVELTAEMCSDGSSETAYGARAAVRYGSTTYEGCATPL